MTAEKEITKILYQNSIDCSDGMLIDVTDIQKVLKLLTDDKLKFTRYHVKAALKKVSKNLKMKIKENYLDLYLNDDWFKIDKESILNAYSSDNVH